jgi:subfamily B ATP-binding cassette protein MsbA
MSEKEVIKRIYTLVKPYRRLLITSMICMVMVSILSAGQAYLLKPVIDKIFINKDRAMLYLIPAAIIIIFLTKGFFNFSYNYLLNKVGQSIIKNFRAMFYSHVQFLPLSFFQKTPTGELISRVLYDITLIQGTVSTVLVGVLKDAFQVIFLIGLAFYHDWQLTLLTLVFLPLVALPIVYFGRKHRKYSHEQQQTSAEVSSVLFETISGNRIVKAFCMEEHEISRFQETIEKLFSITMKDVKISSISRPLMELMGGIGIALVMLYGGIKVINGVSTPGTFFSFLTALIMIYEPFKGVSAVNSVFQQGVAATQRVYSILDIQSDIVEKPDAIELPQIQEDITFENVHLKYDGGEEVLKGINLTIRTGEVIALVGPSGGGKTSVVNLIPRFYEVSDGRITIDGHDIRDVTLKSLRSQIAMVTQQTILFNDTVRNNIAYGDKTKSEEEIIAAARAAHAFEFIEKMPLGFDTVIGESGTRLSGGQRQRLSIARAILKNAPILILDEATSALDTESELEVQKALENLMKNKTTLVIAHRLSTIKNADLIIVIQNGKIVEQGSHDELLSSKGLYETLHQMQH